MITLARGLVIAIPDPRVRPKNKPKWHLCVCPEKRLFLRINSKDLWRPAHPIKAAKNPFLDHDSFVELRSLHFFTESELRSAKLVGEMPTTQQLSVADAAQEAETLTDEQKDLIWEKLGAG